MLDNDIIQSTSSWPFVEIRKLLKERRQLILVTRETPLSLIHINNMKTLTEVGALILPATPSFYSIPKTFEELAATVIDRVIDSIGIEQDTERWQS